MRMVFYQSLGVLSFFAPVLTLMEQNMNRRQFLA